MIGAGHDYYNGVNQADEELVKLGDEVENWFNDLSDNEKFEIMENYYPDKAYLIGLEKMWEGLSWEDQLDIYKEENEYNRGD